MARFSFSMNAKLSIGTSLISPGSSVLQQIYSSPVIQDKLFYKILGNKNLEKRLYNYNKYGNRQTTCS